MRSHPRLCWAFLLLLVTGCAAEEPTRKARSTVSPFHKLSIDQALAKANTDGKLVMIDFCSVTCYHCNMLDLETWSDEDVQAWLRDKTVAIKVDADKDKEAADKYQLQGYPQMVFLRPDGSEVGRLSGFRDAEQFVRQASRIVNSKK
jgi:thiol:disulfide interchange protein